MRAFNLWPALALAAAAIPAAMLSMALGTVWTFVDLTPLPLIYVTVRWPGAVPAAVPLALGLLADLLYGRVPGSGALALLLLAEFARLASAFVHDRRWPFPEVAVSTAACVVFALTLAAAGGLAQLALPATERLLVQAAGSILAYPLMRALLHRGLRLRGMIGGGRES